MDDQSERITGRTAWDRKPNDTPEDFMLEEIRHDTRRDFKRHKSRD